MAGITAPKAIRQQRHQFALAELAAGQPFSQTVARVADQWGCSRRQARNVCRQALDEIVGDIETVDIKGVMARTVERLERLAAKAEAAEQYAAAIGAMNSLHRILIEPHMARTQGHQPRHNA